jgi:hypothetical protein
VRPDKCIRKKHFNNPDIDEEWLDLLAMDTLYCLPLPKNKSIKNNNIIGGNIDLTDAYYVSI